MFPALLRTHVVHMAIIGTSFLASIAFGIVAPRWRILAVAYVLIWLGFAYIVVRPILRETLFTSDGGFVKTNGTWMVQVPWHDICCLQVVGPWIERRITANYSPRPILPLPPKVSVRELTNIGLLQQRAHRFTMLTFYGADPAAGPFHDLLRVHRPDLVPSGELPRAERGALCPHQLPPDSFERRVTRKHRILPFLPLTLLFAAGVVLAIPNRGQVQMVICIVGLVLIGLVYSLTPRVFTLIVSPRALAETYADAATLQVPWERISQIRHGGLLGSSWIADFPVGSPGPASGQATLFPRAVRYLLKRTKGNRINLTAYDLDPTSGEFGALLARVRPDLVPPSSG